MPVRSVFFMCLDHREEDMKSMRMLFAVFTALALVLSAGCTSSGGMDSSGHSTSGRYGGGSGGGSGGY